MEPQIRVVGSQHERGRLTEFGGCQRASSALLLPRQSCSQVPTRPWSPVTHVAPHTYLECIEILTKNAVRAECVARDVLSGHFDPVMLTPEIRSRVGNACLRLLFRNSVPGLSCFPVSTQRMIAARDIVPAQLRTVTTPAIGAGPKPWNKKEIALLTHRDDDDSACRSVVIACLHFTEKAEIENCLMTVCELDRVSEITDAEIQFTQQDLLTGFLISDELYFRDDGGVCHPHRRQHHQHQCYRYKAPFHADSMPRKKGPEGPFFLILLLVNESAVVQSPG